MGKRMSDTERTEQEAAQVRVRNLLRNSVALYSPVEGRDASTPLLATIMKGEAADDKSASAQGIYTGRQRHPFNMALVQSLTTQNVHHSACLKAKIASMIGMGFVNDDTTKKLEDLGIDEPLHNIFTRMGMDFCTLGTGYFEVRRESEKDNAKILALHFLPAPDTWVNIEDRFYTRHFDILARGQAAVSGYTSMAKFGDAPGLMTRAKSNAAGISLPSDGVPSEVIQFCDPSSLSKYYGMPDWLSAVASIELIKAIKQQQFDFFNNNGVPEFFLFITGGKVGDKDWKKIEASLQATVGQGNAGKSVALNLFQEGIEVQLERLGLQGVTDGGQFESQIMTLALDITTAHRTPAIIAGIQIPGKMGAANETVNAILAFQLLTIGPMQVTIENTFDRTLGNEKLNGGLGLKRGDFKLRTVKDEMGLNALMAGQSPGGDSGSVMDTVSRMRQPLAQAQAQGRDLKAGLKKVATDLTEEQIGEILGSIILLIKEQAAA